MSTRRKSDFSPQIPPDHAPSCSAPGCNERGGYKAPRSRDSLHDYQWFCLDHIREYNAKWDYFAGREQDEIEYFMKEAVTGHRPTWQREQHVGSHSYFKLQDALHDFIHFSSAPPKQSLSNIPLNGKLKRALATLELGFPFDEQQLKSQYRLLVKKHHPDMNMGDKESEERFKQIALAYNALSDYLKRS